MATINKGVLNGWQSSTTRKTLGLSCAYQQLLLPEAVAIAGEARKFLNSSSETDESKAVCVVLVLQMLVGISDEDIEQLLQIKVSGICKTNFKQEKSPLIKYYILQKNDGVYLGINHQIPFREVKNKKKYLHLLNTNKTDDILLPLPDEFAPYLQFDDIGQLYKSLSKEVLHKLCCSLPRAEYDKKITSFPSYFYLLDSGKDINSPAYLLLTGINHTQDRALHYLQTKQSILLEGYYRILNALGFETNFGELQNDTYVGSAKVLQKEKIYKVFSSQYNHLSSDEETPIDWFLSKHEQFAFYMFQSVTFISLGRGESSGYGTLDNFNLDIGLLKIEGGKQRVVPLPASLVKQIKIYINYLKFIRDQVVHLDPLLYTILDKVLRAEPGYPLFFFINNKRQIKPITLRKEFFKKTFPFNINIARHTGFSLLIETMCLDDLIALMAHKSNGRDHTGIFSGMDCYYGGKNYQALEDYYHSIGLRVLNPFPQLISDSDIPSFQVTRLIQSKPKPEPSFWQALSFSSNSVMEEFETQFQKLFNKIIKEDNHECEQLTSAIIYSAITRSCLYNPAIVKAFSDWLHDSKSQLQGRGDDTWIDLYYYSYANEYNFKSIMGNQTYFRFTPDLQTLGLIYLFKSRNKCQNDYHNDQIFNNLEKHLEMEKGISSPIASLEDLCSNAIWISHHQLGITLKVHQYFCQTGDLITFNEDKISNENLYTNPVPFSFEGVNLNEPEFAEKSINAVSEETKVQIEYCSRLISSSLSQTTEKEMAIENLKALIVNDLNYLPPVIDWLLRWIIFKLGTSIQPETARQYCSLLVEPLINLFNDQMIYEMDAESLNAGLQGILTRELDAVKRKLLKDHLTNIYTFGYKHYQLSVNEDLHFFLKGKRRGAFVRTATIDYRQYCELLKSIETLSVSAPLKTLLYLVTIFSFRLGLRVGEITKLQIKDILHEYGYTGCVRSNRYGKSKTPSALRLFFIQECLSEEEFKFFIQYFQDLLLTHKQSDLLFGYLELNVKIKSSTISSILGYALKNITNNPDAVFYTLRHSFISNLYLVMNNDYLAHENTGFSADKLSLIRNIFLRKNRSRDILWSISRAAGHANPAMTISTYVHTLGRCIQSLCFHAVDFSELTEKMLTKAFKFGKYRLEKLKLKTRRQILKETYIDLYDVQEKADRVDSDYQLNFQKLTKEPHELNIHGIELAIQGNKLKNIVENLAINLSKLCSGVAICEALLNAQTENRVFKLHNNNFTLGSPLDKFSILKPRGKDAQILAKDLFYYLIGRIKQGDEKEVLDCAVIVLKAYTHSKSYLNLDTIDEFIAVVTMLRTQVSRNQWHGDVTLSKVINELERNRTSNILLDRWKLLQPDFENVDIPDKYRLIDENDVNMKEEIIHLKLAETSDKIHAATTEGVKAIMYAAFAIMVLFGNQNLVTKI